MMMPIPASSSSSSSATVAVDKATSDLLIGPDWTMNIDICDSINSHHWQAKDVVKAVKRRLQHKNPKVQLLALTLLETMVKNCGDYLHFQIAEKNILGEMVRIVKKKTDMHVRDKILTLLDAWQEAFGGPGGKYPQYYWAYEELRRTGVEFPQRSRDAVPIFTPPVAHQMVGHAQAGYGMPTNSSRRLDETMATDEGLSLSSLDAMRNVVELLTDMLQAVNPSDREAVKDELIADLVNQCRSNQKKLMQMLTTTGDEELLGQGLELNDSLQILLAKHDAIATGLPMPPQGSSLNLKSNEGCSTNVKTTPIQDSSPRPESAPAAPAANVTKHPIDEEEEEEDDFAQLARRHSKPQTSASQSTVDVSSTTSMATTSVPNASNALVLADPPVPSRSTKEQDIIDFLSITLSTVSTSPDPIPKTPPNSYQTMPQVPVSSGIQGNPYGSQAYPGNQGQVPYNSYVVPWAQPQAPQHLQASLQPQMQPQGQHHLQHSSRPPVQPQAQHNVQPSPQPPLQSQSQPLPQHHVQPSAQPLQQSQFQLNSVARPQAQPQLQPQFQPQMQSQHPQYPSAYPPPPWAATPGYTNGQIHRPASNNMFSTTPANAYTQTARPMQHYNNSRGSNGLAMNGDPLASPVGPRYPTAPGGQKPFIPSYRLFEDLNVLGSADAKFKMTPSTSPSLSGNSSQGMVGGRK